MIYEENTNTDKTLPQRVSLNDSRHPEAVDVKNQSDVDTLAKHISDTFVRRDGSYFLVIRPETKLCLDDVKRIAINQFGQLFPEIELTNDLVRKVFKQAITDKHSSLGLGVQVWDGSSVMKPGTQQLLPRDGLVVVNRWETPPYRNVESAHASYGPFGAFLELAIADPRDREMLHDWLAWCLQNEADKPNWAPFLFSQKKGTGKSTICRVFSALFGQKNSITENSVQKLTGRFNLPVLMSKFVVCEEINLKPGSVQGNTLKTYITETTTASEAKGQEVQQVEQCCCFVFTSNHMPHWIEADDRRYLVIDLDHEGHASGPNADDFGARAGEISAFLEDEKGLKELYNALMTRKLSNSFNAKALNVAAHDTAIMKKIFAGSQTVVQDQLEELLNEDGRKAISQKELLDLSVDRVRFTANQLPHLMTALGWRSEKVKWGGVDYTRMLYVADGFRVYRGKVFGADGFEEPVEKGTNFDAALVELELIGEMQ